jgi:hypothetical protein
MDERGEFLIQEGQRINNQIASLKCRLRLIENELDGYFPKAEYVEHVSCLAGSAHRVIQEDIRLNPEHAHTVMAMLGSQFQKHFVTEPVCRPTEECRVKLFSGDSYLGKALRGFLHINWQRHFSFSPGRKVMPLVVEGPGA